MDSDEFQSIQQGLASGCNLAFTSFMTAFYYHVKSVVTSNGYYFIDPDDIIQEVFSDAFDKPGIAVISDQKNTVGNVKAWLRTIAIRRLIDAQRKEKKHSSRRTYPDDLSAVAVATQADNGLDLEPGQKTAAENALIKLAEDHPVWHTVFVEYHSKGRPLTEIAAHLGIPYGTVQSYRYRAFQFLRQQLGLPPQESKTEINSSDGSLHTE